MIEPMAQTQNLPQHRAIIGMSPGGTSFHSSSMITSQSDSPIASFANSLGEVDYRSPQMPGSVAKSSSRWQVPGATTSDLHIPARWANNSIESSGHCSPSLDSFTAAYSELFESPMRGAGGHRQQQQRFTDGSTGRYSASVASVLSGGSSGLGRTLSAPLGSALSTSPRLSESWTSSVDHGNLGLTVDPSKGGLALQGSGTHPNTPSLPRFSANPGFAERAARFSAFGSGQFSPSFPLTENGNVGRSPCFENNDSSKRAKVAVGAASRPAAPCSTEVPERNCLPQSSVPEGRGAEKGREEKSTKGEAKASGSRPLAFSASAQVDQDSAEKGRATDEAERATADSDASDENRGQQEASCSDKVAEGLVRTTSTGKKRKSSSADEINKEAGCPTSKEHKGSEGKSKRSKDAEGAHDKEDQRTKSELSGSENSGFSHSPASKESSKEKEQPKLDYIHVRARRGQATDSHSLAERVRREKISERMKYLQDLVPGCSKVTGKAVMLDEIINYVQSIQRQVEFLSMKLAAVTPRPDFSIDNILSKQVHVGNSYGLPNMVDHTNNSPSFAHIQPQQPLHVQHAVPHNLDFHQSATDVNIRGVNGNPMPFPRPSMETFDVGQAQVQPPSLWDGDLQSVVQMGFGQGMQGFGLSGLQRDLPPGHMKMEL